MSYFCDEKKYFQNDVSFLTHASTGPVILGEPGSYSGCNGFMLTISPPSTTEVPYINSLDPDQMPILLALSPRSKLFDTQTTFSPTLSDIEVL